MMTATTCTACGETLTEDADVCTTCGTPAFASGASAASPHGFAASGAAGPGTSGAGPSDAPPPAGGWPAPVGLSSEQRGWSIAAHLGGLGTGVASGAMLGFLAPLVIWLIRKDEDPFTEHHSKEALNFQLTVLVAIAAFAVLVIPGVIVGVLTLGVGLVLGALAVLAASIAWLVLPIIAAIKASNGEGYRYPVTIRFVR